MITNQGYKIEKSKVNNLELLKSLIVKPKVSKDFSDKIEEYNILRESKNYYYLPRYFGIKNFGDAPIKIKYDKINITFNGELREKQQKIINEIMPKILKKYGGIIQLGCGEGKTILSLYIMCKLKLKTLILVHKSFLLDQWIARIKEFVKSENLEIGILQQDKIETNKQIVIGMIQSLSMRNYTREQLTGFGLIIVDECHHIGAKVFYQCLNKLNAKYTLGLSATPTRNDGLTKIIKWYLGDFLYQSEQETNNKTQTYIINYSSSNPLFIEKTIYYNHKQIISIPKMVTNLSKIIERNEIIINILLFYFNEERKEKRNIIILSERVDHLKDLKKRFDALTFDKYKTGLYIGATSSIERLEIEQNCEIIFASYSMAKEGLDIPRLDTIILATPQKDIVQSIGRVMRKNKFKTSAVSYIIDINDDLSIFRSYARYHLNLYTKNDYQINTMNFKSENLIKIKNKFYDLFK